MPTESATLTPKAPLLSPTPAIHQSLPPQRKKSNAYNGTYATEKSSDGSGCMLKVLQQYADEIDFELSCSRGAPSYNLGYAMDSIPIEGNAAIYTVSYSPGKLCEIKFEFQDASVSVTQTGEPFACGFGNAVYADGMYQLLDKGIPVLGCMQIGCTPTPEK